MARLPIEASSARTVRIAGRELVFFGGSSYLALAHDPRVLAALESGARECGLSSGASRETSGNTLEHEALEARVAKSTGFEAALLCPEGFAANVALAQALAIDRAAAVIDAGAHPSLFDAARAAGMSVATFAHRDARDAKAQLAACAPRGAVLFTDGVFPSEGTLAPLPELVDALPDERAVLAVDDGHGFGVLGPFGQGTLAHFGVSDPRAVATVTLSKAFGVYGGAIVGSAALIERARSSPAYLGTTPIPPALARAARTALAIHDEDPRRLAAYLERVRGFRARLARLGLCAVEPALPVVAVALPSREGMQGLYDALYAQGLLAPFIRYHGGPPEGFFRIVVNAAHTPEDLDALASAIERHLAPARTAR
jgi:7-keto-8-aminopelargonate synthetase-like enzyme